MRIQDLFEAASAVLYHTTSGKRAISILQSNNFTLTNSETKNDNTEKYFIPKPGWKYYLSTSRIVADRFAQRQAEGNEGYKNFITFKLDGLWFNNKGYITRPVNYWAVSWGTDHIPTEREYEDRIWSKTNKIPITPITECHAFLTDIKLLTEIQQIDSLCKSKNIPCYVYDDVQKWLLRRPKLSTPLKVFTSPSKQI